MRMEFIATGGMLVLAACSGMTTCANEHGHHPHDHHPACEAPAVINDGSPPTTPPEIVEPPTAPGSDKLNNGFGNGNQDAPGKSEFRNQAENKGGNN